MFTPIVNLATSRKCVVTYINVNRTKIPAVLVKWRCLGSEYRYFVYGVVFAVYEIYRNISKMCEFILMPPAHSFNVLNYR